LVQLEKSLPSAAQPKNWCILIATVQFVELQGELVSDFMVPVNPAETDHHVPALCCPAAS
jgi:hypothetical protein